MSREELRLNRYVGVRTMASLGATRDRSSFVSQRMMGCDFGDGGVLEG